jgi:hypothetical protein
LYEVTEWGDHLDETGKTEALSHTWWHTIKISPCSKALSAEHRPKILQPYFTGNGDVSM